MRVFANQSTLITGGASGIGRALGEHLVAAGATVVLTDIDTTKVQAVAAELGCLGRSLDVRDRTQWLLLIDELHGSVGPIDVLINNAGRVQTGEPHLFEPEDWASVLDVNLYGVVNGIQAVYPSMVERGGGRIVNIASIAGLFPSAGQVSYVASKFGVVGLSYALRAEAVRHGVLVSVACPGIIPTPMRDTLSVKGADPERIRGLLPKGMPVDRCAREILHGVTRNRATIFVTPLAKALAGLMRLSPAVAHRLNQAMFGHLVRHAGTSRPDARAA